MAPRFEKDDVIVETSLPSEATQLRAAGFREYKARTKEVRAADATNAAAAAPSADQAAAAAAAPAKSGK